MNNIPRPIYLNHIISLIDRGMMLFLIGQRRVGKSFILRQVQEWLTNHIEQANVIYINKENVEFSDITCDRQLVAYVEPLLKDGVHNYLLIDEVQDIEDFENALRHFNTDDTCQIIATGSNAYIFSSELSTRLSGRYIEIPIYSLTYREFLKFHGLNDSDDSLMSYLRIGGLPALCRFDINDDNQVRDYLQGVYNTIILKDVILRNDIRNVSFAQNLSVFIADNIGKLISTSSIFKFMKSQGTKISESAVNSYLTHLCNAMLTISVPRYDIHGKRLFEQISKYYFSDHGMRNYLCGFKLRVSIEKVMENVIYHHLVIQGFTITIGILRAGEIDFVAERGSEKLYVQVAYLIASDETMQREFGSLLRINDNYPKYVVTLDSVTDGLNAYNGIHHLHLRTFLTTVF